MSEFLHENEEVEHQVIFLRYKIASYTEYTQEFVIELFQKESK